MRRYSGRDQTDMIRRSGEQTRTCDAPLLEATELSVERSSVVS